MVEGGRRGGREGKERKGKEGRRQTDPPPAHLNRNQLLHLESVADGIFHLGEGL
jgi:hypothetical protein